MASATADAAGRQASATAVAITASRVRPRHGTRTTRNGTLSRFSLALVIAAKASAVAMSPDSS